MRCSLKINELIHLLKQKFIFSTQLQLKIPVFELNYRLTFHQTSTLLLILKYSYIFYLIYIVLNKIKMLVPTLFKATVIFNFVCK